MKLILILLLLSTQGCARFTTTQTDERDDKTTKITTKASSWTFFDSKSSLAKWKASQTEKTQGAEVGGLEQSTSGTNALSVLHSIENIVKAVK